jgi:hypothetical protein
MKLSNGTFCVMPFITDFQEVNGRRSVCCHSKTPIGNLNSAEHQQVLKNICTGIPVEHCKSCYNLESNGVISPRQKDTVQWMKDPEVRHYIENWQPGSELQSFYYDIRFDNTCNLACISCGPLSSSLWSRELGIKTEPVDLDWDWDRLLSAKKIYLAGGEPFLIPRFKELLALVGSQDTQPEIVINTNLTVVNDDIKHTLSKIKKLSLIISVDAWGKANEYHRWPMTWTKFLQNFEWATTLDCFLQFNTVVDAITVLNCHELQQLENQIQNWTLIELVRPPALHLNNLPDQFKSQAQENFLQLKNSRFYQQNLTFRTVIDSIITSLPTPGDPDALREYITTIDQRRGIDHSQYLGIKLT